ncbi:MAG: caspase family protein [Candidatus Brocadia sp.]|nr:MAG: caspase family protein [Candidatus Brocadia sp.]
MGKKALLVGVNKYKYVRPLNGCVNDVRNMVDILTSFYGFRTDEIRTIVDEGVTRNNLMNRFDWLLDEAREGDILVFHFSGHGSQIQDRDGDELEDSLDEILCLHDMDFRNPDSYLLDDDFNDIIDRIPKGAFLTVCIDSCHSGTATRDLAYLTSQLQISPGEIKIQPRFIEPPADVALRSYRRMAAVRRMGARIKEDKKNTASETSAKAKHILLSGCMDDQTSADAFISNDYHGAFTYNLCKTIRDTRGTITYQELVKRVQNSLAYNSFSQIPQLFGNEDLKNTRFLSAAMKTELTCEHGHPLICSEGHPPKGYTSPVSSDSPVSDFKSQGDNGALRRISISSKNLKCAISRDVILLPSSEFIGTVRDLTDIANRKAKDGSRNAIGDAYHPECLDFLENGEYFKVEKVLEFCPNEQRVIGIEELLKPIQLAIRGELKKTGETEQETVLLSHEDGVWAWHFKDDDGASKGLMGDEIRPMSFFTIPFKVQNRTTRGIWSKLVCVIKFTKDWFQEGSSEAIKKMLQAFEEKVIKEGFKLIEHSKGFVEGLSKTDPVTHWDGVRDLVKGNKKALLFIHGTGSSLEGGYEDVPPAILETLKDTYPVILGYDHFTLSKTPLENAREMLMKLKESGISDVGLKFDVITHSRGGLVLRSLVELTDEGYRYVDRVTMVACPAGGTSLADTSKWDSLSKMVNLLTNIFFFAGGAPMKIFFSLVGGLVKFLSQKIKDQSIPGIWAMDPHSDFINTLNKKGTDVKGVVTYDTIGSEFEPSGISAGGVRDDIIDGIADAFFGAPNDLVVDTEKMIVDWPKGIQGKKTLSHAFQPADHVYHLNYFKQAETYRKISEFFEVKRNALDN